MSIQKFTAPTSREALGKARSAFGDAVVILSNKSTADGVEVIATTEDGLVTLDMSAAVHDEQANTGRPYPDSDQSANADADRLAMSTLSFQDYVRERMLRKRHEASTPPTQAPTLHAPRPSANKARPAFAPAPVAPSLPPRGDSMPQTIADELQAMRLMMEERFATMAWLGKMQQHPLQPHLALKLLRAGFSPLLTRSLLEHVPAEMTPQQSLQWITQTLQQNLHTDADAEPLETLGGVYAITGATGVGKTTTSAKLAAAAVQRHGVNEVGLITLDTYRVGAHEQLRSYGRAMGLVAHVAHDRAALHDLLNLLVNKKLVLIDTIGLAPRDPRSADLLELLSGPNIRQLVVLAASMQGDSLDDVLSTFNTPQTAGVLLTKIDEAVKLGPALDAVIRRHLVLRGVANGQRVPEDWARADSAELVQQCLRAPQRSAFDPYASDLGLIFTPATSAAGATYA